MTLHRLRQVFVRLHHAERGAAMAEFVLLVPVMIAMWMGIDYFRSGYARRLDALGQSQTEAWKLAYANDKKCFQSGGAGGFGGIAGLIADLGAGGGDQAKKAFDGFSTGSDSSIFLYGHARSKRTEATKTSGWDHQKGAVGGQTYVLCNEVVPDASHDDNVLDPLKGFIQDAFKF